MRRAAKRDLSEPDIVEAIEKAGCKVYRDLRCDLLVRVPGDPPGILRALECKTPNAKGRAVLDKRQIKQIEFLEETGTPRVTTPEEALLTLSLHNRR